MTNQQSKKKKKQNNCFEILKYKSQNSIFTA
jgi:hypothetical protein